MMTMFLFIYLCVCVNLRYGFGTAGSDKFNIPPNATLQYKIKLKAFEKVSVSS